MYLQQLATSGPMARSPADIAALLNTLAGPDARSPNAVQLVPDIGDLSGSVKGKRIGWFGDWGGAYPCENGILNLCQTGLSVFERLGCVIEPVKAPFDAADLWSSWLTLRAWAIACRMRETYDDPEKRALLKPAMIWEIEQGISLSAHDVHCASEIRSEWFRKFAEISAEYDAFALPSAQVWPFPINWTYPEIINGARMDTYHRWMEIVVPVSLIGLPCLAIPAGFGAQGLPMGLQLFGCRGSDHQILKLGLAYHTHQDWTAQSPDL
jgi:amidase